MKKKGFGFPLNEWITNELSEFVLDNIHSLKNRGEINKLYIERIIKDFSLGKIQPRKVWHLVSLELWFRMFIDNKNF